MKKNVLVFPCGSEIGLEIYRSLRFSKDFELFGASSIDDHGKFMYENYISEVPFVDADNFIECLAAIIKEKDIDFIFPAHDSVVLKLAQNTDSIRAKVITSSLRTCEITRSKRQTYEKLKDKIKTPRLFEAKETLEFPVFIKPDVGQGSKGAFKAESLKEVKIALEKDKNSLVLEYLPGVEYTIDCFTDKNRCLIFSQARRRNRTLNGISVNATIASNVKFKEIAKKINQTLEFRGAWFFQLKEDFNEELTLLEVAPRVAGTMTLCRMQGANLPLLSLYDAMGVEVSVLPNNFNLEIDRALDTKYDIDINFDTIYIDFDDTIILEETPNYLLIGLLYKFIEKDKKIILITKHAQEIKGTLRKHKVSEEIFEKIITLGKEDQKSDYMLSKNAIFIDDSFSERKSVQNTLGIPVFDVSEAVELLNQRDI